MTTDADLPGLDLAALEGWMCAEIPGVGPRLRASLVEGGRSNLTYRVSDGIHEWIVRRPPLGHVLATAHDMVREHTVLLALEETAVPVPRAVALCSDLSVLGAPFYVMESCPGTPYRHAVELAPLGAERTRAIAERLVDTLTVLHAVDPLDVGLAEFGRPDGYLVRQVARWQEQLVSSTSRQLPAARELHRRLAADVPASSGVGIVHGDFRLDNVLVDEQDRITAVLDWEMATLGDPLADLALMIAYLRLGASGLEVVSDVAVAPGFLDEGEVVARYAQGSDRDLSSLSFHLGLAFFKLAVILEGIHYRYLQGQTVGPGFGQIGQAVPGLLEAGIAALGENA